MKACVNYIALLCFLLLPLAMSAQQQGYAMPLGYSVSIQHVSREQLSYAKSLGITHIELAGFGGMLDKQLKLTHGEKYWTQRIDTIRQLLEETGMKVWSIHMPFSNQMDISILDDATRAFVVERQLQLLQILAPVKPDIILFHPSYYLELNKRQQRYKQLIRSVKELHRGVKAYGFRMVVENMLGPSLTINNNERPLLRTLEECQLLFKQFPKEVGIAVDMCHFAQAELLIKAFGKRVFTLHVADGDGTAESHYLPCNGLGKNNWNAIFQALEEVQYKGVFMYECKYTDERELTDCYDSLQTTYANFKQNK